MRNIVEITKIINEKEYEWTKTVIVSLSTIFGLLVSFKTGKSETFLEHCIFSISVLLFGLSILSGIVYLYTDTSQHHKLGTQILQQPQVPQISVKPDVFFFLKRYLFFLSSFLALTSLIVYMILKDK
jgi:hypothetical protein